MKIVRDVELMRVTVRDSVNCPKCGACWGDLCAELLGEIHAERVEAYAACLRVPDDSAESVRALQGLWEYKHWVRYDAWRESNKNKHRTSR